MSATEPTTTTPIVPAIPHPHGLTHDEVLAQLKTSIHGLGQAEAKLRLQQYGYIACHKKNLPA